tara:strand:+ start:110 stop:259 length:150 start_codon:yes stop_codon:yes gene_type:complete
MTKQERKDLHEEAKRIEKREREINLIIKPLQKELSNIQLRIYQIARLLA